MRHIFILAASLTLLTGMATTADAQKLDANGRCHAANGQFAKAEVCKGAAPAKTATSPAVDPKAPYKLDAKGKCHDVKGKMAAKGKCAA